MAPLLRRRLLCFYCGCRSAQKATSDLRQWQCENCEAVNHLDENGEITDPPALDTTPVVRYAQAINRPASPVFTSPDETLFCSTCIKNQLLLTQSLASYLPPTTHPDYATFEASYPKYRDNLEERYPQVCQECEPKVRERIQKTGYAAKTDHLRRMMEKTRGAAVIQNRWDWRYIVVYIGALGWWASSIGQMLWDAMGALVVSRDGLRDADNANSLMSCLRKGIQEREVEQSCASAYQPLASLALVLAFLSVWWNPCLSPKIRRPNGRMIGLSDYYKLQLINIGARIAALYLLRHSTESPLDQQFLKASHAIMCVFTFAASLMSYFAVKMDYTPRVIFPESPEPPRAKQHSQTQGSHSKMQPRHSQLDTDSSNPLAQISTQGFPIDHLASPLQRNQQVPPYQPPTPPPEDNESDSMDWTPSRQSFHPTPQRQVQDCQVQIQPSPFHGRLPPAPISQAQQLRNPPNQLSFRKASLRKQENFFESMTSRVVSVDDKEDSQPHQGDSPTPSSRLKLASPRFFPSDQRTDTGLESLFTAAFSLKDEPPEVRASQKQQEERNGRQRSYENARGMLQRLASIFILCLAYWAWLRGSESPGSILYLRLLALGIAAAIAGRGLLEALRIDQEFWKFSEIMVFALELGFAVYFGSVVKSSTLDHELVIVNGVNWYFEWLIFHEVASFIQELRDTSSMASQESMDKQTAGGYSSDHHPVSRTLAFQSETPRARNSFTSEHRQLQPYLGKERSTALGQQLSQPRVPHPVQRENFVPSSSLSSLSLGLGDGPSPEMKAPKSSSMAVGASRNVGTWNTRSRSRMGMAPWERGAL